MTDVTQAGIAHISANFAQAAIVAKAQFVERMFALQQDESMLNVVALGKLVLSSLIFVAIGLLVFLVAFWCITKVTPFSIRKEIEEDQNTALGIVIGSVIIGLALIISSAIRG